jgi:hypothetical protein
MHSFSTLEAAGRDSRVHHPPGSLSRARTVRLTYNAIRNQSMKQLSRLAAVLIFCVAVSTPAAASSATLFRVFFIDGTSVVTYGELARVENQVIFSLPVGGPADEPRLHTVSLAASFIDWQRTNDHSASTRYQQFSARAESDYQRLTDDVAAVLNDIALSTDRTRALALAEQARRALAEWPRAHFGYRQDDIRDIVALIDGAIVRLGGTGTQMSFELSLVATTAVPVEPMAAMPTPREQLDQIVRVLQLTTAARDRVALLRSALAMFGEGPSAVDPAPIQGVQLWLETQLQLENDLDQRYAKLTKKLMDTATRAAANARIDDVAGAIDRVSREDERLGRRRPEVVQALMSSLQAELDRARRLRLLRDQWTVRRSLFRDYQRSIASELLQLVKAQGSLEEIRRLAGPEPERLDSLRLRLSGGAARLERLRIPEYLRQTHELLVSAWRFAENAANARAQAVLSGSLATAWEASSAAAGSLMMLARTQQELRTLLEPPTLP